MLLTPKHFHVNNNPRMGYTWKAQAEHGIVIIDEDELFNRIEFQHLPDHEYKVSYAMDLGWRYNVDNGKWYRLKGH